MQDLKLALITGVDIPMENYPLIIHQPKLKELAMIGIENFATGVKYLSVDKNFCDIKDESLLESITNFQIFMTAMLDKSLKNERFKVEQLLSLLLPNYKIIFIPSALIFSKDEQNVTIDDNNFELFQQLLGSIFCTKSGSNGGFNPAGKKSQEIAKKLMKARTRVAEEKGDSDTPTLDAYISSLSLISHLSYEEISRYTLYQLYDAMERYSLWLEWDLNIKSRLAGGKPENNPENWMKNIH